MLARCESEFCLLVYVFTALTCCSHRFPRVWLMNGRSSVTLTPPMFVSPWRVLWRWDKLRTWRQMKGQACVRRSFSSGSPSPPRARPVPAFHSNLMIMIFAQDDLCLHSVITPPSFL